MDRRRPAAGAGKRRRDSYSASPSVSQPPSHRRSASPAPTTHSRGQAAKPAPFRERDWERGRGEEREREREHVSSARSQSSGSRSSIDSAEEERSHVRLSPGDFITDRYKVIGESGKGTFGKVLLCKDIKLSREVAIKVIRNVRKYYEAAKIEANILEEVNKADPGGASCTVRYYASFDFKGHYCMVFEALGPSLYDYIKANNYLPPPLYAVQAFADQLLTAIAFMHEMRLIHTDLKLENILLVNREPFVRSDKLNSTRRTDLKVLAPRSPDIRVIDMGGATYDWERKSSLINTRQYRAPEVILGLDWSLPSDIWSAGCILMELYTGELLFQTHDNAEHLALMEAILGPLPDTLTTVGAAASSREVRKYFDRYGRQRYPENAPSKDSIRHVRMARKLEALVHPRDTIFADLVRQLLTYDPATRITAKEALNHRFFTAVRGFKSVAPPKHLPSGAPRELAVALQLLPPGAHTHGSLSGGGSVSGHRHSTTTSYDARPPTRHSHGSGRHEDNYRSHGEHTHTRERRTSYGASGGVYEGEAASTGGVAVEDREGLDWRARRHPPSSRLNVEGVSASGSSLGGHEHEGDGVRGGRATSRSERDEYGRLRRGSGQEAEGRRHHHHHDHDRDERRGHLPYHGSGEERGVNGETQRAWARESRDRAHSPYTADTSRGYTKPSNVDHATTTGGGATGYADSSSRRGSSGGGGGSGRLSARDGPVSRHGGGALTPSSGLTSRPAHARRRTEGPEEMQGQAGSSALVGAGSGDGGAKSEYPPSTAASSSFHTLLTSPGVSVSTGVGVGVGDSAYVHTYVPVQGVRGSVPVHRGGSPGVSSGHPYHQPQLSDASRGGSYSPPTSTTARGAHHGSLGALALGIEPSYASPQSLSHAPVPYRHHAVSTGITTGSSSGGSSGAGLRVGAGAGGSEGPQPVLSSLLRLTPHKAEVLPVDVADADDEL